jgi:acetyl-CoA carboxylase biotin carboxyl carrier protein
VADDKRDAPRPFDVRTVEYLIKLMTEHDLSEVELREGDQRIRVRRGGGASPAVPGMGASVPYIPGNPAPGSAPVAAPPAAAHPAERNLLEIKSPMVGTFYSKPKPDKPEFVSVGSPVKPDTVVCLIEAMKLYNDIKAEVSGRIAEVCVNNGDFVEFNQVLFRVDPS